MGRGLLPKARLREQDHGLLKARLREQDHGHEGLLRKRMKDNQKQVWYTVCTDCELRATDSAYDKDACVVADGGGR
jgi:hypothetical protein